ncbi:MAG: HAMP domain-containing histidine kinase, partial [Clostridia bacterium]|nr:HAMP domain-containing histidine kinase [Clostridia bacterium]
AIRWALKMIKTAQRRFIAITLSILFTVFSVIFGAIWYINGNNFAREVQISLSDAEREYNEHGETRPFRAVAVIEITSAGNSLVVYGEDNFPQKTIDEIVNAAKQGETDGNTGDVYYSVKRDGAKRTVYAVDLKMEADRYHSVLIKTFILLITSFIALALIVWALSSKVFNPIRYILAKQKQFISDASHELKTPVSIISANADVVRNNDNAQYVDSIKKQVERLKFLVNDLLTLARLDEGKVKTVKETFNLSDEVLQAALPFDAMAFEKGKTLNCDIENNVVFEGSKEGIKQIINILLDNAVKYAADGGEIKVSLKKSGARIIISVYNDGSLIPESDSQKIFERFYRGDASRSRDSGGNGLGLSIAKSIAISNKWNITAESVFGKSMTIFLTL